MAQQQSGGGVNIGVSTGYTANGGAQVSLCGSCVLHFGPVQVPALVVVVVVVVVFPDTTLVTVTTLFCSLLMRQYGDCPLALEAVRPIIN